MNYDVITRVEIKKKKKTYLHKVGIDMGCCGLLGLTAGTPERF